MEIGLLHLKFPQVDVERLPEPHGDCIQNTNRNQSRSLYEDFYPVKYSIGVSIASY